MNSHVLAFIERLHAAEVERKTLRQDAVRLKEEREDIEHLLKSERELKNSIGREESSLRKRLDKMQRRMRDMIHSDKYDALASDLRRAMEREEKAHKQLAEYTKQLESIEKRCGSGSFHYVNLLPPCFVLCIHSILADFLIEQKCSAAFKRYEHLETT